MKRIGLFLCFGLVLACSGCGTLQQGTRVQVKTTGFSLYRSEIMVYNNAGPGVDVIPFSRGAGFVAEYRVGKRKLICLGLCREKIPTKIFAVKHGQSLRIPMRMNLTGRTMEQSIGLKVTQNGRDVGTYVQCVYVPNETAVTRDVVFGKEELRQLKEGDSGRPCGGYGYAYW